jgi:hypothetical protein
LEKAQERLEHWRHGVKIDHNGHKMMAAVYTQRGRALAIPVVVLTTVTGTAIFTSISSNTYSTGLQIFAGLLSMVAAVISSVATSLNYGQIAERHRSASVKYGNLRRDIEEQLCFMNNLPDIETKMKDFRTRWDAMDLEAPSIPEKIREKVTRNMYAEEKREFEDKQKKQESEQKKRGAQSEQGNDNLSPKTSISFRIAPPNVFLHQNPRLELTQSKSTNNRRAVN